MEQDVNENQENEEEEKLEGTEGEASRKRCRRRTVRRMKFRCTAGREYDAEPYPAGGSGLCCASRVTA